uniref:Uncharacterized protein n=1 Tax=Lepeophtheirus salmonis TaxID=72036 RepID=A0A0K2U9T9_LEPSM
MKRYDSPAPPLQNILHIVGVFFGFFF